MEAHELNFHYIQIAVKYYTHNMYNITGRKQLELIFIHFIHYSISLAFFSPPSLFSELLFVTQHVSSAQQ
jgi:hypothetical protein